MINAIAIDDEPLAIQLLAGYISKTSGLKLTGTYYNPSEALDQLDNGLVDLMFIDIQMPDISGIEFTRRLKKSPKIVFTTAYDQYALEGFRLEAVDYLLKPFGYEEFLKATHKAQNLINMEKMAVSGMEKNNEFLFLKAHYKIRRVNFNDIIYIEGSKDYIRVFVQNETLPILSLNSLKALELKLPASRFMRVHRSFIVNLEKIDTVERSRIVFGKVYVPVSEQFKDKFLEYLDRNSL
jgi:two-component system, LytTR family, response regulator LytT